MRTVPLGLLVSLALPACAQPAPKPDATATPGRSQRADSVIERRAETPSEPATTPSPATASGPMTPTNRSVQAGDDRYRLADHVWAGADGRGLVFNALNLHDDEDTSVAAALAVARQRGGRVLELVHTGARNVTFRAGDQQAIADPNRMFTDAGRRRTLASLSRDTPAARAALAAFADEVLAIYTERPVDVVVTLHNNTPDGYSAQSYQAGGEYAADAAAVTVRPGTDPDDFFFVTDRALYDALVARGFNAVLQDNAAATDDGSLSVWAAQNGVPYVNVEAERGHLDEQTRMIEALADVLATRL